MAVGAFFYNVPVPGERALGARDVNPQPLRPNAIDLGCQLECRGVGTNRKPHLDVLKRDRGAPSAARRFGLDVPNLSLPPNPSLHRRLANAEQLADLWVAPFTSLVGCNDTLAKQDRVTVDHEPSRSETDPELKGPDQIIRTLGLGYQCHHIRLRHALKLRKGGIREVSILYVH